MRVCFVAHSGIVGGAEKSLLELVEALSGAGVPCLVVVPTRRWLSGELQKRGIQVRAIPFLPWAHPKPNLFHKTLYPLHYVLASLAIAIFAKRWRADLIYSSSITTCVGAIAAAVLRRPHVLHISEFVTEDHGLYFDFGEATSMAFLNRFTCAFVAASKAVERKFRRYVRESKIHTVYTSIAGPKSARVNPGHEDASLFECLVLGKIHEGKGQADAVRAVSLLSGLGVPLRLRLVGASEPNYRHFLDVLVKEHGLSEIVRFEGVVVDPAPYLEGANVVLVCSRCEAFGRVTVEAMLWGKPVIGTHCGGTLELIQNGITGLLYAPGEYRDLACQIQYLYQHPSEAVAMGLRGRAWAQERFDVRRFTSEMHAIFDQATGS
jgi:glycosyltransferase involved in cell wall biosynthesis